MLRRKAYDRLLEWKNRKHKCLIVSGQRQVGKTYIINEFGRDNYDHVICLEFSRNKTHRDYFKGDLEVDSILQRMSIHFPPEYFVPGRTLIIMDEIQECPSARTSLKSFTIDGRFDVIASGSLLDLNNIGRKAPDSMIPTGYEEHMVMYALDFEEFLWSQGVGSNITNLIRECISERRPIDEAIDLNLRQLFTKYIIVGGMPEAVERFTETNSFLGAHEVLENIHMSTISDINRYNDGKNALKTAECYVSIPIQLAESNKRFKYSRLTDDGRKSYDRYMENLLWIRMAGYGVFCYGVYEPVSPLSGSMITDNFKVYLSDTGMLMHAYGEESMERVLKGDADCKMGAVFENAVAACMEKAGFPLAYYRVNKGDKMMEIDFITEMRGGIVAIEVKSGKDRTAPSIGKIGRYYDVRRIVLENGNIHVNENGIEHYPLYAAAFMRSMEPPSRLM